MTKLLIEPAEEGYSLGLPAQVRAEPLEGGSSRYRREIIGARSKVGVQWFTDQAGYDYLQAFYRSAAAYGTASFTIDLIVETAEMAERTAYFVPGSLKLVRVAGETFVIGAQLEVVPSIDDELDELLIFSFEEYGEEGGLFYDMLAQLVNFDFPEAIG